MLSTEVDQTRQSNVNVKTCADDEAKSVCVRVHPGVCGLECVVKARRVDSRTVSIVISESDCQQIQRLSDRVKRISLKQLFSPMTRNPVYVCAEQSGCHPSCAVPVAVLKVAEVALGMALPRDVRIQFVCENETQ